MVGSAYIIVNGRDHEEDYVISNCGDASNILLDLKKGETLNIRWLGVLEVVSIVKDVYESYRDGSMYDMIIISCRYLAVK